MFNKKLLASLLLGLGISATCLSSQAALIYLEDETISGSGLGAVNTVLTISSPNNLSTETGSVTWNGNSDVKTGNVNASQTQTRSLSELNLTQSADLRVVFNPAEPGNAQSINLTNLVLYIFSAGGSKLFESSAFTALQFVSQEQGTGSSGFVFGLDPADIAKAQPSFAEASNRVGLLASATDATGGQETFFLSLAANPGGGGNAIPEPDTTAIIGLGLLGMGFIARRKRGKQA